MSKNKKIRCMMIIALYELTGDEIGEVKKAQYADRHAYNKLPEFCLKENGKIDRTEYYLQFINSGEEKYRLFNILHLDQPLGEELREGGYDGDQFKIDWSFLKDQPVQGLKQLDYCMPQSTHIVFDMQYIGSNEDVDLEIEVVGVLNSQFELEEIKHEHN